MPEEPFQIRRAGAADAAALAELAARTYTDTFADSTDPADLAAFLADSYGVPQQTRELTDSETITFVAETASGLAGFTQVRRGEAPPCVQGEAPVEIWRFYVDRTWHGRGVAQSLMAAAWDAARELGGRTFWLSVWEHNARAMAFYAKFGFRDIGSKDFWVGSDRQTDRIMRTVVET
ncbi:MAG: GNAT family N-acetyltransferase [Thermoanaerobaculia bacterium]